MTAEGDPAYRQAIFGGGYGLMTFRVDDLAELISISTSRGSADCTESVAVMPAEPDVLPPPPTRR